MSGASTLLFTAVMVTVPVLVVAPAAIVSVVFVDRLKSLLVAGLTALADTVTVTAALEAPDSAAVTVLSPPFSEIEAGLSASVTVGVASSSVMVICVPVTLNPEAVVVPLMLSVSPVPSSIVSWVGSMLNSAVPLVAPAAMVSVKSATVA